MPAPPSTALFTFLFSDIEGSTLLWETQPDAMSAALARHDAILRAAIEGAGGSVFKTVGDAFHAAFESPDSALGAAVTAQTALSAEAWGLDGGGALKVRIALHTGTAEQRDGDFFGAALSRTARLLEGAHGGQTLLSERTAQALQIPPDSTTLCSLGRHRLRGLSQASEIWELRAPGLPAGFPPLRLPDLYPHNLPASLSSFIGRDTERAAAREGLAESRLVTLVGMGGSGKTRLALQAAEDARENYPDGAWLVELAALSDPALIEQEIAGILGLREDSRRLRQALFDTLRPQSTLLILDNCEHLIDAVARLTEALLQSCPKLTVLATSREALGIGGEAVLPLPPMGLPPPGDSSPEALGNCDAVRLFVERATAALPTFRFSAGNAAAVASVCTRLDGIPLALELAAARVKVLTPEQIDGRLNDRFRLLTGGSRTALPRQQTLRALVDWSYELLSPAEQCLLRRLSAFPGGWSLGAAEAVCAGGEVEDWEVLDLLSRLAAKSLVVVEPPDAGQVRYHLLQSIHSYTADKVAGTPGEAAALAEKHRDFFLALAEEAEPNLVGATQILWLNLLERDLDNLRAALSYAQSVHDVSLPRLAGAMSRFWYGRSYLSEGTGWLEAALTEMGDQENAVLGKALNGAGMLTMCCGDYERSRAYHERDLAVQRGLQNPRGIARALGNLSIIASAQDQYDRAEAYGRESLTQYQALGDRASSADMLNNLGILARYQNEPSKAEQLYREALAEYRGLFDPTGIWTALYNLGDLFFQQKQYDRATPYFRASLEAQRTLANKQQIVQTLLSLAEIAGAEGKDAQGCLLQAAASRLLQEGTIAPPVDFDPQATLAKSRAALGEEQFRVAWSQGSRMNAMQSVDFVLASYEGVGEETEE